MIDEVLLALILFWMVARDMPRVYDWLKRHIRYWRKQFRNWKAARRKV